MIRFVTAADDAYFARVIGLIGSIIKHVHSPYSISLYNLGLSTRNAAYLKQIPNVTVKEVEQANPHITQPYLKHKCHTSKVIGCYTWKPVVIKQEMELYDQVFWIDAGTNLMADFAPLWEHTKNKGYFFSGINDIGWQCCKYVIDKLQLSDELISKQAFCTAYVGLTKAYYESFVLPCYEYAKDINLFFDDGTAGGGRTAGRHDQTILSVQAALIGLPPEPNSRKLLLHTDNGLIEANITDVKSELNAKTIIYHSRGAIDYHYYKTITDKSIRND
jgi:hypothetical protein